MMSEPLDNSTSHIPYMQPEVKTGGNGVPIPTAVPCIREAKRIINGAKQRLRWQLSVQTGHLRTSSAVAEPSHTKHRPLLGCDSIAVSHISLVYSVSSGIGGRSDFGPSITARPASGNTISLSAYDWNLKAATVGTDHFNFPASGKNTRLLLLLLCQFSKVASTCGETELAIAARG